MERFQAILRHNNEWFAAVFTGILSTLLFVLVGQTPIIRALGLALAIVGISLTLQRFGSMLAIVAGLLLTLSPAFWSQTGGDAAPAGLISWLLVFIICVMAVSIWMGYKPGTVMGLGVVIFVVLFWGLVGTPRSLRITTVAGAWFFYLMIEVLISANPRPDGPQVRSVRPYHFWGLLALLALGVINEPLFVLLIPATGLGLAGIRAKLPRLYWLAFIVIAIIGLRGFVIQYVDTGWWLFPSQEAESLGIRVPYIMADGWREASRWIYVTELITGQFSLVGLLLSLIGLTRLSRWYPTVGVATLLAFAAYALFGLAYFGRDNLVLLLPLLMVQIIWITYAVYALGEWLKKGLPRIGSLVGWLTVGAFALMPLALLLRIVA